jgi:hypothetical protein
LAARRIGAHTHGISIVQPTILTASTSAHVAIDRGRRPRQVSLSRRVCRDRDGNRRVAVDDFAGKNFPPRLCIQIVRRYEQVTVAAIADRNRQAAFEPLGAPQDSGQDNEDETISYPHFEDYMTRLTGTAIAQAQGRYG